MAEITDAMQLADYLCARPVSAYMIQISAKRAKECAALLRALADQQSEPEGPFARGYREGLKNAIADPVQAQRYLRSVGAVAPGEKDPAPAKPSDADEIIGLLKDISHGIDRLGDIAAEAGRRP